MATTVNVPGVGTVQRRYLIIGGAVVVIIVGAAYYMRARSGSGGVTYDPATGSPGSGGGYRNPVPDGPESGVEVEIPNIIDTNAEWGQAAAEKLAAAGWDPMFASVAIGKYLAGVALTTAEADAVRAAWGLLGKPPVNPPNIILIQQGPAPGSGAPNPIPPKPGAVPRRYMIRPDGSRVWIDRVGIYSGLTDRIPYVKAESAARRYRLIGGGKRVWLDHEGRYNGDTQRVP
jgi:hypothetical protein